MRTKGIHHITAFVQNAQQTVDFYTQVLALRLVKKTVNFDAPEAYHLYFGNEEGLPGTIITFFPIKRSRRGRIGGGQVGVTTYVVPEHSLDFWKKRLQQFNIPVKEVQRFNELYLQFKDNSGLVLEIVARKSKRQSSWAFAGVPVDKAIIGFGGAVLYSLQPEKTAATLEYVLGLFPVGADGDFIRYQAIGDIGNIIDIDRSVPYAGIGGAGTVHHIAWRAQSDNEQIKWQDYVQANGFHPTTILDRQYFHSIYFQEHGRILFEIATDSPGFAVDEPIDQLGEQLKLPAWFETYRDELERSLPPLKVKEGN
jgi:glyoxalase family protein